MLILFCFGLLFGSFLNVIATRYDEKKFLLTAETVGGRSCCVSCHTQLAWFELIPLVSFLIQRARCRACGCPLSWQYPISEFLSGAIFALVPFQKTLSSFYFGAHSSWVLSALWIVVFEVLLCMALIDIRLMVIPDEMHVILIAVGIATSFLSAKSFGLATGSFLGPYALMFGFRNSFLVNRLVAVLVALAVFGVIILVTRRRGMGFGDFKLAVALAVVFGWPEIIALIITAFVIGSLVGIFLIIRRAKRMKSYVPFGPFLALGSFVTFLWGEQIIRWYFGLFS